MVHCAGQTFVDPGLHVIETLIDLGRGSNVHEVESILIVEEMILEILDLESAVVNLFFGNEVVAVSHTFAAVTLLGVVTSQLNDTVNTQRAVEVLLVTEFHVS